MITSRSKKIFASIAMLATAATMLTGCSVSAEESDACTASHGVVKSEYFVYRGDGSLFNGSKTGKLRYCETSDGLMNPVYNKEITEVKTGFWGHSKNNKLVFEGCSQIGGTTYKTSRSNGKNSTVTRFACVNEGRYVQILEGPDEDNED